MGFTQRNIHTTGTASAADNEIPVVSIMADEDCDVGKIVTKFFLETCRLTPCRRECDVEAAALCADIAGRHPDTDEEAEVIPLITGSVAEFYIEPMLPLVGDIDLMCHWSNMLAIPRGHPPPTELPAEFHNNVKIFEIIDSHLPGYVYLQLRCLLTQRIDGGKCNCIEVNDNEEYYLSTWADDEVVVHGPAAFAERSHVSLSVDNVLCVRCLSWPLQAADWPTRHRNYGWPDSATLDRVVSNGCDAVRVANRQCRHHELVGKTQWRLSFSRAEIVLINSWTPVQQIVYHMLRFYVKTERLTESADNSAAGTLSNYHIKTLMLWACELKAKSWWDLNLVRICVELLNTLSVWLTNTRCPHYFVNNCNLLDNSFSVRSVASKLASVDQDHLSTWIIYKYIGKCAQLCPGYVTRLFRDVSSCEKLKNAISAVVRCRSDTLLTGWFRVLSLAEQVIPIQVSLYSLTVRSCVYWMNELTRIDKRFSVYFSGVVLLHVAHKISRNGFSDNLKDILSTVLQHNFNQRSIVLSRCKTQLNTPELVELLQKSAVEHLTTYRQLVAPDFGSVSAIVTTDFEALYAYKRGDYQHCLQLLSSQNVHALLYAGYALSVLTFPEFTQLMDDDIVSLTALTMIVNPECRKETRGCFISQLTLLLYLMAQCQLKLHNSVTSQTVEYVRVAQINHPPEHALIQLTLKLIQRKISPKF